MYVLRSFYQDGRLAFNLEFFGLPKENLILSVFPDKNLYHLSPKLIDKLNNSFLPNLDDIVEMMDALGQAVLKNNNLKKYYYPEYLLDENSFDPNSFEYICDSLERGIKLIEGCYYSSSHHSLGFWVMQLYFYRENNRQFQFMEEISISNFEHLIISRPAKKNYQEIKETNIRAFKAYENGQLAYLILTKKDLSLLMVMVLVCN